MGPLPEAELQFRVRNASGAISIVTIEPRFTASLNQLIYAPHRYFMIGPSTMTIGLDQLIASRARPTGIVNANCLMQQAYRGTIALRPPLRVMKLADELWVVADGNSTFVNALVSGWPDLPCESLPTRRSRT